MTRDTCSLAAGALPNGLPDGLPGPRSHSPAGRSLGDVGAPEMRLLRTFVAVVDCGGFSPAAAALEVDLSTVSRQFRELESWLGARLAHRGRTGFGLTAEGRRLHDLARQLFSAIDAFGAGAAALDRQAAPLLRLGVVDALLGHASRPGGDLLTVALAGCVDQWPGLQVQLTTARPVQIEQDILAGRLDAGIIAARPPASGLQQHRLYSEPSSLYVAPGHPWYAAPESPRDDRDLARAGFVVDPYADGLPPALQAACALAPPVARADSIDGVALLVRTGRFAGVLPDHWVRQTASLRDLRAVWPARFAYRQDIVLTCRQGKGSPVLRALLDHLRRSAGRPEGDAAGAAPPLRPARSGGADPSGAADRPGPGAPGAHGA